MHLRVIRTLKLIPSALILFQQPYPQVWQGRLSLKNTEALVSLHFVQGNADLLRSCMTLLSMGGGGTPQQALVTSGGPLRIVQRMRLESAQLDGVQRKMTQDGASCACIAFAAGNSRAEVAQHNAALSEGFIRYMLDKRAAGIINVGHPEVVQVSWNPIVLSLPFFSSMHKRARIHTHPLPTFLQPS